MRKNHSKIVCIKLVHLPYLVKVCLTETYSRVRVGKNLTCFLLGRLETGYFIAIALQLCFRAGMSNMRPFASTPAARTKGTVIWSFNGQN